MKSITGVLPGILLSGVIAVPAWLIGRVFPVIGSPVLGLLFGMVLAMVKRPQLVEAGIKYTSKKLLQYAIILLGFEMNLFNIVSVGKQTLILMAFTLSAALLTAHFAGKLLKLDYSTKTLIGVGSSICGGSAIAATAPVINANEEEVAQSISTIFLFNVIAAFLFPALGHLLGMSDHSFGLWAGTAVNDTSSVVAAGYAYSDNAGNLAVIVKLTRTLMIVPITLVLAVITSRKNVERNRSFNIIKIFPWFVVGFLLTSVIRTFTSISVETASWLAQAGKFVIVMAMCAIGLNTNLLRLLKNGLKPITLGFLCWAAISVTSLAVQNFLRI